MGHLLQQTHTNNMFSTMIETGEAIHPILPEESSPTSEHGSKRKLSDPLEDSDSTLKGKRKQVSVTIQPQDREWSLKLMKEFGQRTIVWQSHSTKKRGRKRGNCKGLGDGLEYPSGEGILNVLRETYQIMEEEKRLARENQTLKRRMREMEQKLALMEESAYRSRFHGSQSPFHASASAAAFYPPQRFGYGVPPLRPPVEDFRPATDGRLQPDLMYHHVKQSSDFPPPPTAAAPSKHSPEFSRRSFCATGPVA